MPYKIPSGPYPRWISPFSRTGFLLFQELSNKFEYYSGALDYMRKAYFAHEPGEDSFKGFLKQIEGWMKLNVSENEGLPYLYGCTHPKAVLLFRALRG
jgi:hypothetical protein